MFLRLTENSVQVLVNMNRVREICPQTTTGSVLYFNDEDYIYVEESLDKIEQMIELLIVP